MKEIVVASRNRDKLDEIGKILRGLEIRLLNLDDFPSCPEVKEDGRTFAENALKKARSVMRHTGKASLADDSGLEVYSLRNRPGVRSARFSGEGSTYRKNNLKLLRMLSGKRGRARSARFRCVVALARPGKRAVTVEGMIEGRIAVSPCGKTGFGYDPLFIPRGYNMTFAQLGPRLKNRISHRARALRGLRDMMCGMIEEKDDQDTRHRG